MTLMFVSMETRDLSLKHGLLLHEVHAFISSRCPPYPIGHAAHAHLGQYDLHHGIDHGCYIADAQGLLHYSIGHELVRVVDEREEVLAFWTYDQSVVHERCETSTL